VPLPSVFHVEFVAPVDPFDAASLLRGVMKFSSQSGRWRVRVTPANTPDLHAILRAGKADGIIAVATESDADAYAALHKPLVSPFAALDHQPFPAAVPDDVEIGRMAADHFLHQGFGRVAFYGTDLSWSQSRYQGLASALKGHAREIATNRSDDGDWPVWSEMFRPRHLRRWLKALHRPIAVMACNDGVAVSLVDEALQLGFRIPEDIAVLGVDNQELQCHMARVPLSSVDRNAEGVGYESAVILDRLMHGLPAPANPVVVRPRGVSARRSTELSGFDDPRVAAAVRFIHERAASPEPVSVDDVAEEASVSRSWLERRFKELLGRGPGDEIRRARLDRARELLVETDLKLRLIALQCGFKHLSHLSAAFKDSFGLPPSAYRARHRRA
jgi:LacI family transcriptional regulator, galactose operon repressor